MLSKPEYGWTDFSLEGTDSYGLSDLNPELPCSWLEEAIHGLKMSVPFCVEGYMEPTRFLCVVSYWNCHIICEDDVDTLSAEDALIHQISHTNMIDFCRKLYDDINSDIDGWVIFMCQGSYYADVDLKEKYRKMLCNKLDELANAIIERESDFDGHVMFF